MPGTIQVSVLDIKGLSSSSPHSSFIIKVSMGKREYQTWNKGDFSFPLTTLRDNLLVTLQDAEGNEISHIGVQSMTIIEKGIWDDLFPLEGGGHVHMKLQFILSEDERNRIRGMRESALKKKQGEVLNSNLRYSETASGVGDSVASSLYINHEVSDSQTSIIHGKASRAGGVAEQSGPLSNSDTSFKDSQSNNGQEEGTIQKQITLNATDRSEESSSAPISSGVEVHHMALVDKIETRSPHANVPVTPIFPQDDSSMLGCSKSVVSMKNKLVLLKLEDNLVDKHEKKGPLKKAPSSIKKMISNFETSLAQERRPPITPAEVKSSSRVGKEGPLKDQDSMHVTKEAESSSGRLRNPAESSTGRLENPAESSSGMPENQAALSSVRLGDSEELSTGGLKSPEKLSSGRVKNPAESSSGRLTNPAQLSSGMLKDPFLTGDLQQIPPDLMQTGEHIGFDKDICGTKPSQVTRQLIESSTSKVQSEGADATIRSELKSDHKEMKKEREKSSEGLVRSSSLKTGEPQIPPDIMQTGEHICFDQDFGDIKRSQATRQLTEPSVSKVQSGVDASIKSDVKSDHKQTKKEREKSPEGFMRSSTSKTATVLERKDEKTSGGPQPSIFHAEQKDSGGTSVVEGGGEGISSNNSCEIVEVSNNKLNSVVYCEDEQYHYESSGAWIFPHDTRHLCITTGVNEHGLKCGLDAEMKKSENKSQKLRKANPESSAGDASTGPVRQAIKIAIVIGFGILVLLTRQREP